MSDLQQKSEKGPARLITVHSSGKCMAVNEGKNVFLDYGIPGEEVFYITQRKKQGFRAGHVTRVASASPYRIPPFCKHNKECGGCPWQHIEYNHQLRLKHEILLNALNKYNIEVPEVPDVVPSPQLHFYRHRVEYAFSSPCNLGFHNTATATITNIEECSLQPGISRSICEYIQYYAKSNSLEFYDRKRNCGFLRSLSIRINKSGQVMLVFGLTDNRTELLENLMMNLRKEFRQIASINYTVHPSPSHSQMQGDITSASETIPFVYETLGNFKFRVHASSFFQPNAAQAENIFTTIKEWANLKGNENIVDLYTGVGTIAHFLAGNALHITGIEGSRHAIEDARANAVLNNITNIDFIQGDILETFTLNYLKNTDKPDIIVLDPPRSGTLIEIKKTINNSGAHKVIYLSCNPVSLAFDLKQLTEVYKVTRIQPFDMLPHTHHLETLVLLER